MVQLSYKGKITVLDGDVKELTVREVLSAIERSNDVEPTTLKLLYRGRAMDLSSQTDNSLDSLGIEDSSRLLVLGSSRKDVSAVQNSRDLPGLCSIEREDKIHAVRRRRQATVSQAPKGPYTFQSFEAWQMKGLQPGADQAMNLLKSLAADPGIVQIMNAYKWTVLKLSEMPPEGKVGVSPVCILGMNINAGQEICLRLRTDDLKGFRRIQSIKQTLCHELAHMVHSEHDAKFKQLNSELWRQCEAATQNAHSLLEESAADWEDREQTGAASTPTAYTLGSRQSQLPGSVHPLVARLDQAKVAATGASSIPAMEHLDGSTEGKEQQVRALLESGEPSSAPSTTGQASVQLDPSFAPPDGLSGVSSASSEPQNRAEQAVQRLLSTPEDSSACQALKLLITILQNALSMPAEAKYRRLRLENPAIKNRLAGVEGTLEILAAAGFVKREEGNEAVLLLEHCDLAQMAQILSSCKSAFQLRCSVSAS